MIADRPSFSEPAAVSVREELRDLGGARRPAAPARSLAERRAEAAAAKPRRRRPRAAAAVSPGSSPGAGAAAPALAQARISTGERLLRRATFGWTLADQARLDEVGHERWLDEQLDWESIDDSELEEALARALPTLALSPYEVYTRYGDQPGRPIFELILAAVYRALYSRRQLYERMVTFWSDHFNIHIFSGLQFLLKPTDDREVVRRHALGTFPELLSASAHSPAMLSYLTNDSNVKDHPNENYARELMELHTLGVGGGYTEKDVKEVARCFTGWAFYGRAGGQDLGRFFFNAREHDEGSKKVLGQTIAAGGEADGERVLQILANRRATAKFLAEKLLRYFWGYQPKKKAIRQVADVWQRTGGDLKAVLRSVLRKQRMAKATPKLKRPFHLTVSTLRALFAELRDPGFLLDQLFVAGQVPFNWPPPNGYPDSEAYWSGFVLPRWNFASTFLLAGGGGGDRRRDGAPVRIDLPFVDPQLPVGEIVDGIDTVLLAGGLSAESRASLTDFLKSGKKLDRKRIHDAIGLAVASPEFQEI